MTERAIPILPVLVFATLISSGCFRYTPVPLESVPEGREVRMLVTRQGAFELSEVSEVGGQVPFVTGRIVNKEAQEIFLRIPVTQRRNGFHLTSLDQIIRVPRGEVLQVELRELERGKTALFGAGALAGSAFIIISIMDAFGGDASPDDGSGPVETKIPVPLIFIPIGR